MRNARHRRGSLTLEWVLLATVLVIGVVGGLVALRDSLLQGLVTMASSFTSEVVVEEPATRQQPPLIQQPGTPPTSVNP